MTTTNYDVRCAHCDETKFFSQMKWRERTFHMHEKCPERNERTPGTVINNIQASSQCDSTPDLNARNGISRDVGGEFYPEQRDLTYETTNEDAADDDGECNDVEERDELYEKLRTLDGAASLTEAEMQRLSYEIPFR